MEDKVPQKVKIFFWRAVRNGLPTMDVLCRRGMNVDRMCPRCGDGPETTSHMLLTCKHSTLLWKLSPLRWETQDW